MKKGEELSIVRGKGCQRPLVLNKAMAVFESALWYDSEDLITAYELRASLQNADWDWKFCRA